MATIALMSPACQASAQRAAMSLTAASPRSCSTVCWVGAAEPELVEAADAAPRAYERVLHRVLGVVQGAEHPVAVGLQFAAVRRYQLLEGAGVAGPRGIDQRGGRGHGPTLPAAMNPRPGPGSTGENRDQEEPA